MSLTIYIASSFELAPECEALRQRLEQAGHTVPDVWWNVRIQDDLKHTTEQEFYAIPFVQAIAARHWRTINNVDALILVAGPEPRSFTGANIEVGYAIARSIPVLILGVAKRSAMYCPAIHCYTTNILMEALSCFDQEKR